MKLKQKYYLVPLGLACLPVLEIGIIVLLVNHIGVIASLLLVAAPTIIGLFLYQVYAPRRVSPEAAEFVSRYSRKEPPGPMTPALRDELVDFVGFISGALLLTLPGFITDFFGLLCLNRTIGRAFAEKVVLRIDSRKVDGTKDGT